MYPTHKGLELHHSKEEHCKEKPPTMQDNKGIQDKILDLDPIQQDNNIPSMVEEN